MKDLFRCRARAARLSALVVLVMLAVMTLMLSLRTESRAGSESVSVGLLSNRPTVNDEGINWLSYQGLMQAESELGVSGTVYTAMDSADYEPNLQQCVDDRNDLCISVGSDTADATLSAAEANTNTNFAVVDASWESYPDNLRGIIFAADQVGYLAGTLGGLMTESDLIGVIGGWPVPVVDDFAYGYRNGAQCSNPNVTVVISYTYDFRDPTLGAQFAQDMMAQGADVIFAPAGSTGAGAVLTATESGVWGIGVDTDYYYTVFDGGNAAGSEMLLTSAMKRTDSAIFDTIQDVVSVTFTSGTELYDLEVNGVGLSPFHEADPFVTQDVRDRLENVRQGILNGTIDVADPCQSSVCLPLLARDFPVHASAFELGGHVHDWGLPHADRMHYAGMDWAKVQVRYPDDASDIIAASHDNGLKIQLTALGSADMVAEPGFEQDVADWVGDLAAGGADAIEVWNEPNIDRSWTSGDISPADYADLLCAAYDAVKAADSETLVIGAAPAPTGGFGGCGSQGCDDLPWLDALYNLGAADCMDYIAAHHNAGATSPSARSGHPADPSGTHHSWYFLWQTEEYYDAFDGTLPLFYTELGYASQEGVPPFSEWFSWATGTTNAEQAAWLTEAAQLSMSTGMADYIMIWNIDFPRYGYDPQDGYAIIRPDGSCPACESLHELLGSR